MKKIKLSRRTILSSAGVVIVLASALGVGLWAGYLNKRPAEPPVIGITPLPAIVDQAQTERLSGDSAKFTATVQKGLDDPASSPDIKDQLYIQLGGYYEDKGQWQLALDNYLKANQAGEKGNTDKQAARMYVMLGNKDKAIEYFKKAIAIWPADAMTREDDLTVLRNAITNLGGQP